MAEMSFFGRWNNACRYIFDFFNILFVSCFLFFFLWGGRVGWLVKETGCYNVGWRRSLRGGGGAFSCRDGGRDGGRKESLNLSIDEGFRLKWELEWEASVLSTYFDL